ncbi:MAG TPA: DUF1839 family protein [Polyangiaceae bacterium]|nr:DUF1839 family protein [Polyangiaceae bacterium]
MTVTAFAAHPGLTPIDPTSYEPHALHTSERAFRESNCYIDVWIEVLHALKLDPVACMAFVLSIDWEDDQWTFFKPPHEDLVALYGVDVQELNVWRPLLKNAEQQLSSGKLVLSEVDAFYLPDTQGTDYRTQHTKTTIGIQSIDVEGKVLDYFHNSSYHRLSGEDFTGVFRLDSAPGALPFFAEFVRLERVKRLPTPELVKLSVELLRKHLDRRPRTNPIARWQPRFVSDIEWLKQEGLGMYHGYAFATVRQLGAAFEFGATYLRWLGERGETGLGEAAADFDEIAATSKSLVLKMARAVNAKKDVDFSAMFQTMASRWASGMERLVAKYG